MATQDEIRRTWSGTRLQSPFLILEPAEDVRSSLIQWTRAFSVTVGRLIDLLDENGEDEFGQRGPSQHAFKNALTLVPEAENISKTFTSGSVSVDSLGGIRVTWRLGSRELRLVCPANDESTVYIYQQSPDGHSRVNENVTSRLLADRLIWLAGGVRRLAAGS